LYNFTAVTHAVKAAKVTSKVKAVFFSIIFVILAIFPSILD